MRAVNLIPDDARRGGGAGAAGRSGGAAYILLGGLAALVLMMGLWALAGRDATQARTQLAELHQQAADAQRQAQTLAPFGTVNQERTSATASVHGLIAARFAWSKTLDAFARVLPADVRLSSLAGATPGTTTPTVGAASAPSTTSTTAGGVTVQLNGCAPSMARVARLMPRLRAVPGVSSVTLASTTHAAASAAPSGSSTAGSSDCPGATFQMSLGFAPAAGTVPSVAPAAAAAAAAGTTPPATTTTPAAGTQ
jgi:Tfp pilus assembly protein PilN